MKKQLVKIHRMSAKDYVGVVVSGESFYIGIIEEPRTPNETQFNVLFDVFVPTWEIGQIMGGN